ncbi:SCO family protein [Rhodoferax sp.]|uniref:SCO family protein n=1 Tax=Rhodoferax sp. TaxID=50421 RepID=UPI001EBF970E|nr:SCO family protein [Rhodoferax sp.]MBT9508059.1 SCO family protein [Rhodoferax sp.]
MLLLLLASAMNTALAVNEAGKFDQADALRVSQAAIGGAPANYTFLDRQGRPVRLSNYLGKPLLVSFIYTGCFQVCPTTTRSLHEAVQTLQKIVGPDQFNVVSIGFNQPFDSPQALRAFAAQHSINAANWEFLSPHGSIVEPLTRDFGFSYESTAAGIDHVLKVTLLDAQGRIYTQVYGDLLTPEKLGEPLRQLLRGAPLVQASRLSDLVERVRIICTVYDPTTGGYRYDYGLILEIAGGLTFFLAMIWFFASEWISRRRARWQSPTKPAPTVQSPL